MVRAPQTRPRLASHYRSLRYLGLRDHAATDPRGGGDPLLRTFPETLPARRGSRAGVRNRASVVMERPGILLARAQHAEGRPPDGRGRRFSTRLRVHPDAGRHRRLHGRRDSEHRLRAAACRDRRKRTSRGYAPRRRCRCRSGSDSDQAIGQARSRALESGRDGTRRDRVPAARAALFRLPARRGM